LLASLPDEESPAEVSDPAMEGFQAKVRAALCALVPLAYPRGAEKRFEDVQRRPLIDWARIFAKAGRWGDVRGYRLWSRLDGTPARLRVALRVELFAQAHVAALDRLSQRRFVALCEVYGVGQPCRVQGGDQRAVELTAAFVQDLLAGPVTEEADPLPDREDGQNPTRART
jgi:hypothetical protein